MRGSVYIGQREYERAIQDFNQAIKLIPESGYNFFSRGKAYERLGNKDQALSDFKKAYDLGVRDLNLHLKLKEYEVLK